MRREAKKLLSDNTISKRKNEIANDGKYSCLRDKITLILQSNVMKVPTLPVKHDYYFACKMLLVWRNDGRFHLLSSNAKQNKQFRHFQRTFKFVVAIQIHLLQ